jgi:hypothetical protein
MGERGEEEEEEEEEEETTLEILRAIVKLGANRLLQRRHADVPEELDSNPASRPVLEHDTRLPFLHVLDQLQTQDPGSQCVRAETMRCDTRQGEGRQKRRAGLWGILD